MDDSRREPLCSVSKTPDGKWSALLALPTDKQYPYFLPFPVKNGPMDGKQFGHSYTMKAWGLHKLGPGTWRVNPSIHQAGVIHAYVVLCEVPEPAPWE